MTASPSTDVHPAKSVLAAAVAAGQVAGGSVSVWRNGAFAERAFEGFADLSSSRPVTDETVFRLASMTKPVVAVAVLQLVERGLVQLDDPVDAYLPSFRRAEHRAITLRDLLTHSSGLGQGPESEARVEEAAVRATTLQERVDLFARIPGDFPPGTATGYSAIVGFDVLGRIVEVVSRMPLGEYLMTNVFRPLNMMSTTFTPDAAQRARLATTYEQQEGTLVAVDMTTNSLSRVLPASEECCCGSAGLYGTLADYEKFAQMLLAGGGPVLTPESVRRLANERAAENLELAPGWTWGLGVLVVERSTPDRAAGTYGWAGAFGTYFRIDPALDEAVVLMVSQADIGGAASAVTAELEQRLADGSR